MKTTTTRFALIAFFATAMALSSCQKEKTNVTLKTNDTNSFQLTDQIIGEVTGFSDNTAGKTDGPSCRTVTIDSSNPATRVFTFNYGGGCQTRRGIVRSGEMIVSLDQTSITTPGVNITISFNNYMINNNQITGGTTAVNTGYNGNGNLTFTFNSNLTSTDITSGATSNAVSTNYYEWLTGSATSTKEDDTYAITGGGTGTDVLGNSFTESITTPLIKNKASNCVPFAITGVVLNQTSGQSDKTTDYGSGLCDNLAIVTQNGNSQQIVLQ